MLKLAILGYGAEGKSVKEYFKTHPYETVAPSDIEIKVFDNFKDEDIDNLGLEFFARLPSVHITTLENSVATTTIEIMKTNTNKPSKSHTGLPLPNISLNIVRQKSLPLPALRARALLVL